MTEKEEEKEAPPDPFSALYELGLLIFQDDAHDLTKGPLHTPEEIAKGDAPIHHWIVGLSIMAGSLLGKIFYALESTKLAEEHLSR